MKSATLICDDEQRRHLVREHETLNGLDYLEVLDKCTLCVTFLDKAPKGLKKENVRITGGRRVRDIRVTKIRIQRNPAPDEDDCLEISLDKTGDFSTYTLCLVMRAKAEEDKNQAKGSDDEISCKDLLDVTADTGGAPSPTYLPYPGFDPRYYCLDFSFKVNDPSDLDCLEPENCPPPAYDEPEINYLAKDYASFRQLILDRLAFIMPNWQERHVPDLGITLVELLAYTGDYLSYYQDAVATEAYLATARQRISVRRHARLVDYLMHEGCNARAWVHIWTATDVPPPTLKLSQLSFITAHNNALPLDERVVTWDALREIPGRQYEVFQPLAADSEQSLALYKAHNEIHFYTWGDKECCLPRGAASATLIDGDKVQWPPPSNGNDQKQEPPDKPPGSLKEAIDAARILHLEVGDVLIFEEIIGPKTGFPADADPARRHAVRLSKVDKSFDPLTNQPLTNQPLLEIAWKEVDALPFPLCISVIGPPPDCRLIENVSVARGNIILVDHGRRYEGPDDWCVPTAETEIVCLGRKRPSDVIRHAGYFQPRLDEGPLTHAEPYPNDKPAAVMLDQDPRRATPWIRLTSRPDHGCEEDEPVALLESGNGSGKNDEQAPVEQYPAGEKDGDDGSKETSEQEVIVAEWEARRDLLASRAEERHFVAEIDNEGRAHLRFGDGELGRRPDAGDRFSALYRVGVGQAGNVGAEAISHAVTGELISGLEWKPRNPLPARGGIEPETMQEVKLFAPHAFRRRLERAIIAQDYADIIMRDFAGDVQRAAAALRWTGSWYEVLVAVDALGQETPDKKLLRDIKAHLENYRRIGHDVEVKPAQAVPLEIELTICVDPDFLRGHVKAALLARFSNRQLPDGGKGFFHPDNLTFGEGVYLSQLVVVAQEIAGVTSVEVTSLNRLFEAPNGELGDGVLPLGPLEIAQLDNDPSLPENGILRLIMEGGR